jgi:hypothetical protein
MPKATAIFLTLLLTAISWPLLKGGPPVPSETEVVLRFAGHLESHPDLLAATPPGKRSADHPLDLEEASSSPEAAADSGRAERDARSRSKGLAWKPGPDSDRTLRVYLKASNEPLIFANPSDWQNWIHSGIANEGVRFLEKISTDRDLPGFIDLIDFVKQSERDPGLLREIDILFINLSESVLLGTVSSHQKQVAVRLESLFRESPESSPERDRILRILEEYRARPPGASSSENP